MSGKGAIKLFSFLASIGALVLCQNEKDTCPDGSPVVSWSQWMCNVTAQTSSRTGSCNDTNTTVVQSKRGPVVSWTEWSPWSPSCGGSETVQSRSRLCQVPPDNTPYCSTCGYQNTTATQSRHSTISPCCEDLEYGPWSSWLPGCGELPYGTATTQSRSRMRDCTGHLSCPPCPPDQETRTAELTSWGQWGEWSGHLRPCAERPNYRSRQHSCPNVTNQDGHPIQSCCVGSSEEFSCYGDTCPDDSPVVSWTQWVCNETAQTSSRTGSCTDRTTTVVQNKTGPVVSWVEWSPWYPPCGVNETIQSRYRLCQVPPDSTPYCSTCGYQNTTATEGRNSTIPPCCEDLEYGSWSSWSPHCGELPNGTTTTQSRSRMRDCTGHLSCPPCPLDQETRTAVVTSWGQWGEWSGHLRPCTERVYRSRQRFCPNVTNQDGHPIHFCCVGSSEEFGCYGDTCPNGFTVVSWSQWECNETALTSYRTGSCNDTTTTVTVIQNKRGPVVSWVEWSPWSPSCGGSETVQFRSRLCQVPPDNTPYCSTCGYQNTTTTQSRHSTIPPCCEDLEYGLWSSWSPHCGELPNGTTTTQSRSRMRDCTGHLSCPPCPLDQETRTAVLTSWGQWGEWSGHLRPCAEGVYRFRQRFCPNVTNQDGHPIQTCCVGNSAVVEFSCCGGVLQLTRQSCSSTTSCHYKCRNVTSHIASDAPSPLATKWVCLEDQSTCDTLGDVSNKNVSVPTATVPPVPVYVWPIIVLASVSALMLLIAVVIAVLCYKYCERKKKKTRYKLLRECRDSEGIYGHILLQPLQPASTTPSPTNEQQVDRETEFMVHPTPEVSTTIELHPDTSYHSDRDEGPGSTLSDSDGELTFSNDSL